VHERADHGEERTRIRKQDQLPEEQRLTDDDRPDGQVHRVTDVAVEPADHEALGRRHRRRGAHAFEHEANKRLQENDDSSCQQHDTDHAQREPVRDGLFDCPSGQPPRDQTGDDARRDEQENERSSGRSRLAHAAF
jgi:hypothetical protein